MELAIAMILPPQPMAAPVGLVDSDFAFERAFDNFTSPRTATLIFVHVDTGFEVKLSLWLDEWPEKQFANQIGSATASAYVGGASKALEWARDSELVSRVARRFK